MIGNMPGFDQGYSQGYRDGYLAAMQMSQAAHSQAMGTAPVNVENGSRKRRKVGKYQKAFGKNLKALKKKHPRTQVNTLMKRAHRMTRRDLK